MIGERRGRTQRAQRLVQIILDKYVNTPPPEHPCLIGFHEAALKQLMGWIRQSGGKGSGEKVEPGSAFTDYSDMLLLRQGMHKSTLYL